MSPRRARVALLTLVGVDALALTGLRPHIALLDRVAAPHRWVAEVGSNAAALELAGAALWLAAAWVALGLAACAASALPGAIGRTARWVARAALPRAMYRLAAGAAGMGVVLAPVGADAATPPARAMHAAVTPTPAWPTDDVLPSPQWPTSAAPTTPNQPPSPRPTRSARPAAPVHDRPARQIATSITVAPGDSLWRIAGAHLAGRPSNRRIAAAWPRWYAANRAAIGADPNHITPGEVLVVPSLPIEEDPS
jgi:hypothetical protein